MDEKVEQPDETQEPSNEDQEHPARNQDQLIEIYKLQSQLANSISNRRITIHKFYLLVISGLALIFAAYFKLPTEVQKLVSIGHLVVGLALLGVTLSLAWFILINSNLRLNIIKYEALKKLEDRLEYQFFKDEWEFLEKYGRGKTYWEISYIEIFIPILFFFVFSLLLYLVSVNSPDKPFSKLLYYPSILTGAFCFDGFRSWQTDREIRGMKRWKDRTICWVSLVMPLVIMVGGFLLFRSMGFGGETNKEVEVINKKPAETGQEETEKEQTIQPDGKEQDGNQ